MTTNDNATTKKNVSIERFIGEGLSESAASTAVSIQINLGSRELALPLEAVCEIAEFYESDSKKAIRVATMLGGVALVESVTSFVENDYIDYLINKLEAVGLAHMADDQDTLRDFASEIGVDLSLGYEFGLKVLLDTIMLMPGDEIVAIAESIGIYADLVEEKEDYIGAEDESYDEEEEYMDEEMPSFDATSEIDDELEDYLEDVSKDFINPEEEVKDNLHVLVDEDEEWVIE